ncbi:MAG: helix-turn-helix domain-containing protein, partial [Pseudonocardiaceae bacterium]
MTQQRLQQAATIEFAAYGLAGTTMERIATRAGINKERLYNYFG